ncbi:23S rRNA (cytosine1962-C5)-methyltransferase [Ereboglobus sp. PH5-10]|uniref:class I SAM-dependent rRNA methyltransferase n=1 Tax=Ereboglobus sp. PH5-10 TaxID=2940629 RepID=UPI002406D101|nr:class I SAM-dependent rRNA methyltransferase [Ereboglobus sp. PH5-10]MDF9826421.1 23S rRNA (cytosine1962-C5)-methyltransferase [Ereboglobus sp. PH5-10]
MPNDSQKPAPDAPRPKSAPAQPPPPPREERRRPWAQLKYFTFQPAIFPRLLGPVSPDAKPGDLVTVYDKAGYPLGAGLYNPRAKIVLRVVAHGSDAAGGDAGEAYFEQAIRRAVELRRDLFKLDETTDAYRLINSDGDGLSGLTIDRYADTLFCDVYSFGIAQRLPRWLPLLHELAGTKFARVHVDHDIGSLEGIKPSVFNETNAAAPRRVKIRENGIRHEVDFAEGHKTGFFCDQRENRRALARFTKGARVLDLCSYTGGFSLSAKITGGADDVTAVDLDEAAITQAKRNANLNQARIKFVHADAFAYARQMQTNGEKWDVVVLDPPKFIFTRDESGNWEGRQKYEDLNQLAISLVKPGGIFVTCSCSGLLSLEDFEQHVIKAAHRLGRRLQFFDRAGPGPDHPVYSNCLDSRYLKVLWSRVA